MLRCATDKTIKTAIKNSCKYCITVLTKNVIHIYSHESNDLLTGSLKRKVISKQLVFIVKN